MNDLINKFSILNGAKYFSLGIVFSIQYLYQLKKRHKIFSGTTQIDSWKSNILLEENIKNITKSKSNFAQTVVRHHVLLELILNSTVQ